MYNKITITLAEPSAIIRNGLSCIIRQLSDINFHITEVSTIELLSSCLPLYKPDIIIINPNILGCYPVKQLVELSESPDMKCLAFLYAQPLPNQIRQYDGTVSIYDTPAKIKQTISQFLPEPYLEADQDDEVLQLSCREREIICCIVRGMTNRQIAQMLALSTHTVHTHRRNIARKLQVHSTSGLTVYAIMHNLIPIKELRN